MEIVPDSNEKPTAVEQRSLRKKYLIKVVIKENIMITFTDSQFWLFFNFHALLLRVFIDY